MKKGCFINIAEELDSHEFEDSGVCGVLKDFSLEKTWEMFEDAEEYLYDGSFTDYLIDQSYIYQLNYKTVYVKLGGEIEDNK